MVDTKVMETQFAHCISADQFKCLQGFYRSEGRPFVHSGQVYQLADVNFTISKAKHDPTAWNVTGPTHSYDNLLALLADASDAFDEPYEP